MAIPVVIGDFNEWDTSDLRCMMLPPADNSNHHRFSVMVWLPQRLFKYRIGRYMDPGRVVGFADFVNMLPSFEGNL